MSNFFVRAATRADAPGLLEILNGIIRIGGTTALEEELQAEEFAQSFVDGPGVASCVMAEAPDGLAFGFQYVGRKAKLPAGWGDIATFARQSPKVPGVGSALFAQSRRIAKERGMIAINATIRADNIGGLAFYKKMGFEDYSVSPAVPLRSGRLVDRISKRYDT